MNTKPFVGVILAVCVIATMASCGWGRTSTVPVASRPTELPTPVTHFFTEDFIYTTDGYGVTVIGYVGMSKHAVVPELIEGIRVTTVASMVSGRDFNDLGGVAIYSSYELEKSQKAAYGLISITIPGSVTSIGDGAFYGCPNLIKIFVDATNSHYKVADGVLFTKDGTVLVCHPAKMPNTACAIPNGVTSIGAMAFSGCSGLTDIAIPEGVTNIGNRTFLNCSNLVTISLPHSLINMGDEVFYGCDHITNITIPKGVTNIGESVFYSCFALSSITIPESVTSIGTQAFIYCRSLTSLVIPDGVVSIGENAFSNCYNLTSITLPGSVVSIGDFAFASCTSLTNIEIDDSNKHYVAKGGALFTKDGATLICYPAGNNNAAYIIPSGVTSIGNGAFFGCPNIISITIPDGVTSIGNVALAWCNDLATLIIPSSVSSIGFYVFSGSYLTNITVDEANSHYKVSDGALRTLDGEVVTYLKVGSDERLHPLIGN